MADEIKDIAATLQEFFAQHLTGVAVQIAFPDERAAGETERQYPAAALSVYDIGLGNDRRYGGMVRTVVNNRDNETCELRPVPIPVNLYIQMDTYCLKQTENWNLQCVCMQIFGDRHTELTTATGRKLWIIPESQTPLDSIEKSLFRTSYRFLLPVWFESPQAAQQAFLVLEAELNMNDKPLTVSAVAG